MLSSGQQLAKEQLQRLEAVSQEKLRLIRIDEPEPGYMPKFLVEIDCSEFDKSEDGLPLRLKEKFSIYIPSNFPFEYPSVWVNHSRFSGFTHVQWKRYLCLYLSPETEWIPSDGIFGLVDRLRFWLERGANNSHETDGEALHPPVIYDVNSDLPTIVCHEDTPKIGNSAWLGFAQLTEKSDKRSDLIGWTNLENLDLSADFIAASILLPEVFPLEYPRNAKDLFSCLKSQDIKIDRVQSALTLASIINPTDAPLYLVLGTPMRGIMGEQPRQHLAVWCFPDTLKQVIKTQADSIRLIPRLSDQEAIEQCKDIAKQCRNLVTKTIECSPLSWCSIVENRPEVTQRRDASTPMSWFNNKRVALWGCGAIGSHIAETITRAGAQSIVLRDNKKVTPGILVRQNFLEEDIGNYKAEALSEKLSKINPKVSLTSSTFDIARNLTELPELSDEENFDLIIDATASSLLSVRLEHYLKSSPISVPIVSMIIGQSASSAILTVASGAYQGSQYELYRRIKLSVANQSELQPYFDEFWPSTGSFINFQPEPGCSDPTFIGSAADMQQLCGSLINKCSEYLTKIDCKLGKEAFASLLPGRSSQYLKADFQYPPYLRIHKHGSYEVRIAKTAWDKIQEVIDGSPYEGGRVCETGGLLFGQYDQAAQVVWISDVIGPPPDSIAKPEHFECGIEGTEEKNKQLSDLSRGAIHYLGMWHTHPVSKAAPSKTDLEGMTKVIFGTNLVSANQLLLIVGYSASTAEIGTYKFSTNNLKHSEDKQPLFANLEMEGSITPLKEILNEV